MTERITDKIWVPTRADIKAQKAFIFKEVEELGENAIRALALTAAEKAPNTYNPRSGYAVGAALLGINGKVYAGANYEGATLSTTVHAETSALVDALNDEIIAEVGPNFIKAIAISHLQKSDPCGECRQRIIEHTPNCLIIDSDLEGNIRSISSLVGILPNAFGPSHLE